MKTRKLTKSQEKLADLLVQTKINAKVRRRRKNPDGSFSFYLVYRDTSPIDFAVTKEEFALKIHEQKPDAPLSPIYINLRNLPDNLVDKIGESLAEIKISDTVDFCTAIPKAATVFGKAYAQKTNIPYVEIFDKVDGDQKRAVIAKANAPEGKGKKIIIIDDIIVHGNSKIEALREAEKLGYQVVGLVVLIDRGQGGVAKIEEMGYRTYAAMPFLSLLSYLVESKQIARPLYNRAVKYLTKK